MEPNNFDALNGGVDSLSQINGTDESNTLGDFSETDSLESTIKSLEFDPGGMDGVVEMDGDYDVEAAFDQDKDVQFTMDQLDEENNMLQFDELDRDLLAWDDEQSFMDDASAFSQDKIDTIRGDEVGELNDMIPDFNMLIEQVVASFGPAVFQ